MTGRSGHWEGDLISGRAGKRSALWSSAKAFTMLLHLPPIEGHNSPRTTPDRQSRALALAAVRYAIADTIGTLPDSCAVSDLDQGIEMASTCNCGSIPALEIYFCDPRSPWQRGRTRTPTGVAPVFPEATDLARHSARNSRLRGGG